MNTDYTQPFFQFLCAARNQKVFDQFYYDQMELSPEEYKYIPRPTKWVKKNSIKNACIKSFSPIIAFLWSYFIAYFYIALISLRYALIYKKKFTTKDDIGKNKIAFAICEHSYNTILKILEKPESVTWLAPPNANISNKKTQRLGIEIINAASLLNLSDILRSSIDSIS